MRTGGLSGGERQKVKCPPAGAGAAADPGRRADGGARHSGAGRSAGCSAPRPPAQRWWSVVPGCSTAAATGRRVIGFGRGGSCSVCGRSFNLAQLAALYGGPIDSGASAWIGLLQNGDNTDGLRRCVAGRSPCRYCPPPPWGGRRRWWTVPHAGAAGLPEPWRVQQLDERSRADAVRAQRPGMASSRSRRPSAAWPCSAARSTSTSRPRRTCAGCGALMHHRWPRPAMTGRAGDDYAARVYRGFRDRARALGRHSRQAGAGAFRSTATRCPFAYCVGQPPAVGTSIPNAYTDRTRMIVRSGTGDAGEAG